MTSSEHRTSARTPDRSTARLRSTTLFLSALCAYLLEWPQRKARSIAMNVYTQGDSDVISVPAGFRRHLVGKTLRNVFHCDIAEILFVGKLVTIQTFS